MKDTIVKKLLEHITVALAVSTKTIFHVNNEYFLKKEQKQMDKFAIDFLYWYLNDDIKKISFSYKDLLKEFKKQKGYI